MTLVNSMTNISTTSALYTCALNKLKSLLPSLATTNEKVDGALSTISKVGNLTGVIASVADASATIGLATEKIAIWTTPLFLTSIGLRICGIALTTKSLIETHLFSKKIKSIICLHNNAEESAIKKYSSAIHLINFHSNIEKSFIKKHFDVEHDKLNQRLTKVSLKADSVQNSDDNDKKEKYQNKLKNIVVLLDKRMKHMKLSKAFTITASVVSIVATLILIFSPAAPVGFVLVGIVAAFEIGHLFKMWQLKKHFEQAMKLNKI